MIPFVICSFSEGLPDSNSLSLSLSHISYIDTEIELDLQLLYLTECDWIKPFLFKNLCH